MFFKKFNKITVKSLKNRTLEVKKQEKNPLDNEYNALKNKFVNTECTLIDYTLKYILRSYTDRGYGGVDIEIIIKKLVNAEVLEIQNDDMRERFIKDLKDKGFEYRHDAIWWSRVSLYGVYR